jgi:hypothetical protein
LRLILKGMTLSLYLTSCSASIQGIAPLLLLPGGSSIQHDVLEQ